MDTNNIQFLKELVNCINDSQDLSLKYELYIFLKNYINITFNKNDKIIFN